MKKLILVLSALLLVVFAAGCGGDKKPATSGAPASSGAPAKVTLKIGATPVPHAEILAQIKPMLEKENIALEVIEFSDYIQPNMALGDKQLDANFFQHEPYLLNFIGEHKELKLKSVGNVHVEPMGVYSKKIKKLDEIKDGGTIAIPNDPTNGGRALLLLEKAGVIRLKAGLGVKATLQDITENAKHIKFQEIEAAQAPRSLEDVDAAVINTNFAMQAKLNPLKDAIFIEDKTSPYANIVAVRTGDENRKEIKALMKALQSPEVKSFLEKQYKGAIIPAF
ncbi:MAG: MetQ/NlpA family ABC transporter substrate-binding protein [Schwartzia sp.]|nr:MetQ/NlpA family ABC transporter substrate-binding protein [Schwartzia sp. (in: firmicutes)]